MTNRPAGGSDHSIVHLTHRNVLAIALPITLSNLTTPLVGIVDTMVVGQIGQAHLIGGVAVGSLVFSFLYWALGFLRMGTTGLTAQAVGAVDKPEVACNLMRALLLGAAAGVLLLAFREPLLWLTFKAIAGSEKVEAYARIYINYRIWAAPAALANLAIIGWFIGLGRAKIAFLLQVLLNATNLLLALALGLWLGLGVKGVGMAAAIAELAACGAGLLIARLEWRGRDLTATWSRVLAVAELRRFLAVNRDIMVRTLAVLTAFVFFTSQGARAGDVVLAANAMLYQFLTLAAYFLDGFAFAAEALVGQAVGARSRVRFVEAVRLSTGWAAGISIVVSLAWLAFGGLMIDVMTTSAEVRTYAKTYLPWAALAPAIGVWCYQLDGIFIGATRTRDMRNMMLLSLMVYFIAWWLLAPHLGNHALWAALHILLLTRAVTLALRLKPLLADLFPDAGRSRSEHAATA